MLTRLSILGSVGSQQSGLILCTAKSARGPGAIRHSLVALRQSYCVRRHLWMPAAALIASVCTGGTATAPPVVDASADVGKITRFQTLSPHLPTHSSLTHELDQPTQQILFAHFSPQRSSRNSASTHHREIAMFRQFVPLPKPPTLCHRPAPTGHSPDPPVTSKIPEEAARSGAVTPPRAYHSLLKGPEDHG